MEAQFGRFGLLASSTQEQGFFEFASSALLIASGAYLLLRAIKQAGSVTRIALSITGLVFVVGGLEEISWGQHLFGFQSHALFAGNRQQETNLHNFIAPWLFGLFVNLSFYVLFVFMPLLAILLKDRLFSGRRAKYRPLSALLPSANLVLVFCFGFALQKYFIVETYADTAALLVALCLVGVVALRQKQALLTAHLVLVASLTAFFMTSHEIFRYENNQYEIRELVFIYAMVYWILHLTNTLRQRAGQAG